MTFFKWSRTFAISRKEFFHIFRDPFTLGMAFVLPLLVVIIFGYAMEFNQNNVEVSFLDLDRSQSSRSLLEKMSSSSYFRLKQVRSPEEGMKSVKSNNSKAFIYIPPHFDKNIRSDVSEKIQVLIDGTDSAAAGVIQRYLIQITNNMSIKVHRNSRVSSSPFVSRYLFNPELNSKWFSIPGIMVVIMAILCTLLTSLTIAREWEKGSMELLLSTPVKPLEIILGKLFPYATLNLISVVTVYVLARLWFDVPFRGSHLVFLFACFIFLTGYLALGLAISVILRQQLTAMQAAMIIGLLPTNLLSGFIFPVENMPQGFQWLASIFPVRWFMIVTRDQFLKGSSLVQLSFPIIAMGVASVILVCIAVVKFKGDLD